MDDAGGCVALIAVVIVCLILGIWIGGAFRASVDCAAISQSVTAIDHHIYDGKCWLELTPGNWSKTDDLKFTVVLEPVK